MKLTRRGTLALLPAAALAANFAQPIGAKEERSMSSFDETVLKDAYIYLLGRAIVIRQEKDDLAETGIDYNVIKYNPAGSANFVNPNLDVAYMEAWIAVDDATPVILEIPRIEGRYYTAQILNEWGEVITNINDRNYPSHPHGKFAFVAPGSTAPIAGDAARIELHSRKAKMLARVELQDSLDKAVELQKQFTLTPQGKPRVAPVAPMAPFDNATLIGVELFDNADEVLASALDVSPIAPQLQAKVHDIAQQAKDPAGRAAIDKQLRGEIIPQFLKDAVTKSGVFMNSWLATIGTGSYGSNYLIRTAANLVGLWANVNDEVIYFVGTQDADGKPLHGDNAYVIDFPARDRPDAVVDGYWSVILVDVPDYRVVPNPLDRFNFNNYSSLKAEPDGSLKILLASQPDPSIPESNWLPAPKGRGFSLTLRTYVPKDMVRRGEWFPPAVAKIK